MPPTVYNQHLLCPCPSLVSGAMLFLLLIASAAASQRGHYIVDYQRLPLYQEFYLSPGVYRPLFTGRQEAVVQARAEPDSKEEQRPGPPVAQALQQPATEAAHEAHVVEAAPGLGVHEQQQPQPTQEQQVVQAQQQHHGLREEQNLAQQQAVHSIPVLQYSNSMTPDGSYSYKYETADGLTREESSVMEPSADGHLVASVKGSYSYPGPDGRIIRVNYVADEGGFRASGDHLPSSLTDTVYNFKYIVP